MSWWFNMCGGTIDQTEPISLERTRQRWPHTASSRGQGKLSSNYSITVGRWSGWGNLFALWKDDLAEGWKWRSFLTLRNKPSQRSEWDSDAVFLYYFFYLIKGAVSWKLWNFKQWQLPPIWVKLKSNWSKHEKKMLKPVVRYIIHVQKETGKDKLVQQKKRTETYCNCGFWKLVSLTVFHVCCLQRLI